MVHLCSGSQSHKGLAMADASAAPLMAFCRAHWTLSRKFGVKKFLRLSGLVCARNTHTPTNTLTRGYYP